MVRGIGVFWGSMAFFLASMNGELFRFQADAPIHGFRMPMFDKMGEKVWECTGDRVRYLSDTKIKIEQMYVEWYIPHRPGEIDMVIRSSKATISLPQQRASSKTLLRIMNPGYTILGNDWIWEGKQQANHFSRILIRKNAHVTFYENTLEWKSS